MNQEQDKPIKNIHSQIIWEQVTIPAEFGDPTAFMVEGQPYHFKDQFSFEELLYDCTHDYNNFADIEDLQADLKVTTKEKENLEIKVEDLETEIEELEAEKEELEEENETLEIQNKELVSTVDSLEDDLADMHKEVLQKDEEIAKLRALIAVLADPSNNN